MFSSPSVTCLLLKKNMHISICRKFTLLVCDTDHNTPFINCHDILRTNKHNRSSPNCTFYVRCHWSTKRNIATVGTIHPGHTCRTASTIAGSFPAVQNIKRKETLKLDFLLKAIPDLIEVNERTTYMDIMDVVKQKYG